jgi:DNA polymerase I
MLGTSLRYLPELDAKYAVGADVEDLDAIVSLMLIGQPTLAVDIETFGLGVDARRIKSVAVATQKVAVVFNPRDARQAMLLRRVLSLPLELVFHNSPFDVPNLGVNHLLDVGSCGRVVDTLLYARLAMPDKLERKNLETLAAKYLGYSTTDTIQKAAKRLGITVAKLFATVDLDSPGFAMGNAVDAIVTARLLPRIREAAFNQLVRGHPFTRNGVTGTEAAELVEREQHLNRMMLRRSVRGLRVDLEFLDRYREQTGIELSRAESTLHVAGIRPGNGNDLVKVLDAAGALPSDHPRTPTGRPSTVAAVLERLNHPLSHAFVTAKQIAKVQDDYLQKVVDLSENDMIHPTVSFLAATTGRMSVGDPPLQQFPGPARGIILADRGDSLVSLDWAQIEPVTIANIAGETSLLAGYEDGSSDLYTSLAKFAGLIRKTAKVTLLAQLYGEGLAKLAGDLGVPVETAQEIKTQIFTSMPKVAALVDRLREVGAQHRKVFTLSGRILPIPMGKGFDGRPPSVAVHKAVNYFVQGSAYDLLAETMMAIEEAGFGDAVYLAMHDELVVSKGAADDVRKIMETPPERLCRLARRTPVLRTDRADLGERWAAA